MCLMEMQNYPVDWYTRTFGRGEWELLLLNMAPLLDARIESAKASVQLNGLLLQLQKFNDEKVAYYGKGDTPCLREAERWRSVAASLAPNMLDYITYTIPLQFMTVLDPYIDQAKLDRLLSSSVEEEPLRQGASTSEGRISRLGDDLQNIHLSETGKGATSLQIQSQSDGLSRGIPKLQPDNTTDQYREMTRLWPMFSVIFKSYPGYDELVSPVMMSDLSSHFERMVRSTSCASRRC